MMALWVLQNLLSSVTPTTLRPYDVLAQSVRGEETLALCGQTRGRLAPVVRVESHRRAMTSPARHPGARPAPGTWIDSASRSLLVMRHEMNELEFHISPAPSSSRPHTGVGTNGTRSTSRRDIPGSSVSR